MEIFFSKHRIRNSILIYIDKQSIRNPSLLSSL